MNLLTAINRILPILGERPVDSIESRNPTVAVIRNAIRDKTSDLHMQQWWFNTFKTTFYPDPQGEINIPSWVVAWVPDRIPSVGRGGKLIKTDDMSSAWDIGVGVEGTVRVDVDFEDLPQVAATYVLYSAMSHAYLTDIGLEDTVREWQRQEQLYYNKLVTEHLRNRKYSTRNSPRYRRYFMAVQGV